MRRLKVSSRYNAKAGIADFWEYVRQPVPYRWPILGVSCLMTFGLLFAFMQESVFVPPEPPRVTFINTFPEGRTDAEIVASNVENQRRKEQRQAERAELLERKVDAYKALGRATGLDVDAMAAQAEIENARERAAEEARRQELYRAGETVADGSE